jgi:hypothetical protein
VTVDAEHNVALRAARDRLIDLLSIGDTYPLTDLDVPGDQLKVAYGGTAKIVIRDAQVGVEYQLCNPKGKPLENVFSKEGSGATLTIESPKVTENVTYRIQAAKIPGDNEETAQAPRFLEQSAQVEVGIDTTLPVRILNPSPIDPDHAWIVAYNTSVDVQIEKTQEGVQYSLVLDGKDLSEPVRTGNLGAVVLPTGPREEDTLIQVRATKTFLASENRAPDSVLLDTKLNLGVMANSAAAVSADAAGVVDYLQAATIRIAATQASAKYLTYIRPVQDADFVRDAPADPTRVPADPARQPSAGKLDLQVKKPEPVLKGSVPQDWEPIADAAAGGSELIVRAAGLTEEVIVVVRAIKAHREDSDKPTDPVESSVWLNQAAVVRVRPNPALALRLRVPMAGNQSGESMQVYDGQPGVYYYFRPAPSGPEFPLPAYFHKRDALGTQNKGIGEDGIGIAVGIDFSIADDPPTPPADRARDKPATPRLPITPIPAGGSLKVRAVKAQTGVDVAMARDAQIPAVPAVRTEPDTVAHGASVTLVIPASDSADEYRVTLNGAPLGTALRGDGGDLTVTTDALTADALFEVQVRRVADTGLPVERVAQLVVKLKPDA